MPVSLSRRQFITLAVACGCSSRIPYLWSREPRMEITGEYSDGFIPLDEMCSDFLQEYEAPGMAVSVSFQGRNVYERGFGWADVDRQRPIQPHTLFRIASLSKPLTAVAVLQLVERGEVSLDDRFLDIVPLDPLLAPGQQFDPRLHEVTIRQLLQHTAGWDRGVSFDPIGRPREISKLLGIEGPPSPLEVTRYALGLPLDFDPGTRYAYSNVGYLCLGRLIEHVCKANYVEVVQQRILTPLGITQMRLGKALLEKLTDEETRYYHRSGKSAPCLYPPQIGVEVPIPYGAENLEGYESHGGWVASAIDLAKFAGALASPESSPLLKPQTIDTMWQRPAGSAGHEADGSPKPTHYGCGWSVRPVNDGGVNAWHTGRISGTSTLMVRRWDGWAWSVLFNADTAPGPDGPPLANLIDPRMHTAIKACRLP